MSVDSPAPGAAADADPAPVQRRRSDGRRNRQRLLEVARAAFSSGRANVTLDSIAQEAGVGIGTLYRHFPTRAALVEAVYRDELGRLCDSAAQLLASHPPDAALRIWMDRYADFVATKRGMADALRAVIASGTITSPQTRATMAQPIRTLLDAGAAAGTLRADVLAQDVVASLAGVLLACGTPDQREQAGRMLDLLMDGLRAH